MQEYSVEWTISLLVLGAILILFGLRLCLQTITLLRKEKEASRNLTSLYFIILLVLFFEIAYGVVIYLVYHNIVAPLVTLIGVIFLFGAIFVVLLNYLLKKTLSSEIRQKNSFARFVPKEFLQQLAKKSVADIQLGDYIETEMTVMVVDIRSFTRLADQMENPQMVFQLLNEYLSRILPIVKSHSGFIDKFLGDGMLVLFPSETKRALDCALQIFEVLKQWNRDKGRLLPLNIGIGLNCGNLILGTIGSKERMENTVISDVVNMVYRIEPLNKRFGTKIIVTKNVIEKMGDTFLSRSLGVVQVRGKDTPVPVAEIYNADSEEQIRLKNETFALFQKAIDHVAKENYREAKELFAKIIQINPSDTPATFYQKYCEKQLTILRPFTESIPRSN